MPLTLRAAFDGWLTSGWIKRNERTAAARANRSSKLVHAFITLPVGIPSFSRVLFDFCRTRCRPDVRPSDGRLRTGLGTAGTSIDARRGAGEKSHADQCGQEQL